MLKLYLDLKSFFYLSRGYSNANKIALVNLNRNHPQSEQLSSLHNRLVSIQ